MIYPEAIPHFSEIMTETLKYMGLDKFETQVDKLAENKGFRLALFKEFDSFNRPDEMGMVDYVQTVLAPLIQSVEQSEAVQLAKSDLVNRIKGLEEKNSKLEREIEKLKEFEVYYRLTKGLK